MKHVLSAAVCQPLAARSPNRQHSQLFLLKVLLAARLSAFLGALLLLLPQLLNNPLPLLLRAALLLLGVLFGDVLTMNHVGTASHGDLPWLVYGPPMSP